MMYLRLLCLTACMVSFAFAHNEENESFSYREELEALKISRAFKNVFKEEDMSPALRSIQKDVENYKEITLSQRLVRFVFMSLDVIVVTPKTMPKLYAYTQEVCKKAEIPMPIIFLSKKKGFFNAAAQKLLMSTGAIIIGQKLLCEISDQELEAVVAHEIGHIKYNHVNQMIILTISANYIANKMVEHLDKGFRGSVGDELRRQFLAYSLTEDIRSIMINKSFEKQADEFAYKVMGKGAGLIKFFERMQQKEQEHEGDFIETYAMLENNKAELAFIDNALLKIRYYKARVGDLIHRAYAWYYYNTPFGPHPSHEARIEAAKKYLAEHPEAA